MNRKLLISLAATAAFAAGCETVETTKESAVGVDRHQRMMVSADAVNQSADKAYKDVLAQAQKQNALDRDPATVERVKRIASRLIPATGALRPDAPGWKWEMHVLSSKEVNAWCMPGGKIAVYTGLIEQMKPTDDELAAVMGHEIGHALREHGRERASEQAVEQLGVQVLGALTGVNVNLAPTSRSACRIRATRRPRPTASVSSSPRAPATIRAPQRRSGKRWRSSAAANRRNSFPRTPRPPAGSLT